MTTSTRIYELLDALHWQKTALEMNDFYLWRGARMCIDAFWGRRCLRTREEFERIRIVCAKV